MLILTIRTDKPEAELGLFEDDQQLAYETWLAHRELAETIHKKITTLLQNNDRALHDVEGIVCFAGPGSFTGLRIGLTVGNALAQGLPASIVAAQTDDWKNLGVARLLVGENQQIVLPEYGAAPNITLPKR